MHRPEITPLELTHETLGIVTVRLWEIGSQAHMQAGHRVNVSEVLCLHSLFLAFSTVLQCCTLQNSYVDTID